MTEEQQLKLYDLTIAETYKFILSKMNEIVKLHPYGERMIVIDAAPLNDESLYAYRCLIDLAFVIKFTVKINCSVDQLNSLKRANKFFKKAKRTTLPPDIKVREIVKKANLFLQLEKETNWNCADIYKEFYKG